MLNEDFFQRSDTVQIAKDLLGCMLYTKFDGVLTAGKILETEAYLGIEDKACHSYGEKKTKRVLPLYEPGGMTYVYLCYGFHHLFNIVTNVPDQPEAVLIRSIQPLIGIDEMRKRRPKPINKDFSNGPGKVSQALGIKQTHTHHKLKTNFIWIEKGKKPQKITSAKRIGIDYAGKDADLPYRFLSETAHINAM